MTNATEPSGWVRVVTLDGRQSAFVRLNAIAAVIGLRKGGTRLLFHTGGILDICGLWDHWTVVIGQLEQSEAREPVRLSPEEIMIAQRIFDESPPGKLEAGSFTDGFTKPCLSELLAQEKNYKDAERYRWLLEFANNETGHTSDGDEINITPWLHFDDVVDGETISDAIDRHIETGDTNAVS